jgi:hypothetical protein
MFSQLSDPAPLVRLKGMTDRYCVFCGDETGACRQISACEVRAELVAIDRRLRIERRIGRWLTARERDAVDDAHRSLDWLHVREALQAFGPRVRILGKTW